MTTRLHIVLNILFILALIIGLNIDGMAQHKDLFVRIAKLTIDSAQLDNYKAALKEHAETAVKVEPGVITLYAVYEKDRPTSVTVFEIYADNKAYQSHILTPHFLQYKSVTKNMVKSLQLTDVSPIALESKAKLAN